MSKLFEWTLYGILIVVMVAGIAFAGTITRAHPSLPIILLLLTLILGFLFYKVPDFFEADSLPMVMKCCFYTSLIAALICLVSFSKEKAYIEKFFFEGKIKHYDVEFDTDQGTGSATSYYLDNVSSSTDSLIAFAFIVVMIGIPYFVYRLWQKAGD